MPYSTIDGLPSYFVVSFIHLLYLELNAHINKVSDLVCWFSNTSIIPDLAICGFYSLFLLICTPEHGSELNPLQVLAHV